MSHVVELLEFTRVTQARQIDEDKGILYDLAVLGPESANGRDYPESTQRALLPLLEGRQAFADHHRKGDDPSVYHVLGVWRECRVESGKTRGNFHYFKSHPLAPRLVEAARRPELNNALGFSINARGRTRFEGGRQIVEGIEKVISVDCVAQPATVAGLYESRDNPMSNERKTIKQIMEALAGKRPGYVKKLREMAEAGVMSPDAPIEAPPEGDPPAADHKQAIRDAMKAMIDDDSLSEGDLLKKLKALLKVISGGGSGGDDTPADTEESRKLKAENGQLLAEKLVRKAAAAAKVAVSEKLVESLARPGMTEAQAAEVVNELKPAAGGGGGSQKPRSAAPVPTPAAKGGGAGGVQESRNNEGEIPADAKGRAAWLKQKGG